MHPNLSSVWEKYSPQLLPDVRRRAQRIWNALLEQEKQVEEAINKGKMATAQKLLIEFWSGSDPAQESPKISVIAESLAEFGHSDAKIMNILQEEGEKVTDSLWMVVISHEAVEAAPDDQHRRWLENVLAEEGYQPSHIRVMRENHSEFADYLILYSCPSNAQEAADTAAHMRKDLQMCGLRVWHTSCDPRIKGAGEHPVALGL